MVHTARRGGAGTPLTAKRTAQMAREKGEGRSTLMGRWTRITA